jgi:hypothetical protein
MTIVTRTKVPRDSRLKYFAELETEQAPQKVSAAKNPTIGAIIKKLTKFGKSK